MYNPEYTLNRREFIEFVLKSLIPITFAVGLLNLYIHSSLSGTMDVLCSLIAIILYFFSRRYGNWPLVSNLVCFLGFLVFLASGYENMSKMIFIAWLPIYAVFYVMVSGVKNGLIWVLHTLIVYIVLFLTFYRDSIATVDYVISILAFLSTLPLIIYYEKNYSRQMNQLHVTGSYDHLTKLFNRKVIMEILMHEISNAKRNNLDLAILLIDLDHFKKINDNFGHEAGDKILENAAMLLKNNIRDSEFVGRIGGEEFLIVCPCVNNINALQLSNKLNKVFQQNNTSSPEYPTISIGIGIFEGNDNNSTLLRKADLALMVAKNSGRNCSILFDYERIPQVKSQIS